MAAPKRKVSANKEGIIHIRTVPADKSLIKKAADAVGLTVSAFMLQTSIREARKELAEMERISFSSRDVEVFFAALTNPPPPNAALKSAFKDYDKQIKR